MICSYANAANGSAPWPPIALAIACLSTSGEATPAPAPGLGPAPPPESVSPCPAGVGIEGGAPIGAELSAGALIDGNPEGWSLGPITPPGPIISDNPDIATGMVAPPVKGAATAPPTVINGPIIFLKMSPIRAPL